MEVEVVLRQVGEGRNVEPAGVHAIQFQSVGGHFHDHVGHAMLSHVGQNALEIEGFRGSAGRWHLPVAMTIIDGADDADRQTRLGQHGF